MSALLSRTHLPRSAPPFCKQQQIAFPQICQAINGSSFSAWMRRPEIRELSTWRAPRQPGPLRAKSAPTCSSHQPGDGPHGGTGARIYSRCRGARDQLRRACRKPAAALQAHSDFSGGRDGAVCGRRTHSRHDRIDHHCERRCQYPSQALGAGSHARRGHSLLIRMRRRPNTRTGSERSRLNRGWTSRISFRK